MQVRRGTAAAQVALVVCSMVGASSAPTVADRVLGTASHAAVVVAGAYARTAPPPPLPGGTRRAIVRWTAGRLRRELVEVAPAAAARPLPLVVVLHGRRQTPWRAERVEGWDALAAAGQAVIAYGAGYAGSWNAGSCCGSAVAHHIDDDAYLLHLLRVEKARHLIDGRRVFLVGFSNGGMLAYRFACLHSADISAFAVVAGALEVPSCRPSRALSVLDVEGNADRVVPYGGSAFSRVAGARITSVPRSLRSWQAAARGAAEVQLVRLPGVGHEWPTRRRGWDATERIWRFLDAHPAATSQ